MTVVIKYIKYSFIKSPYGLLVLFITCDPVNVAYTRDCFIRLCLIHVTVLLEYIDLENCKTLLG